MKKNRSTLKDYFKKGAIPTESNFADLIDSMLNQEEDAIAKLPNDPLKITAIGVDEALINFYRIEKNEEKLSWQIKQKPNGVSGLNIGDTAASRLFIENGTGNIGVGTTTPKAKLQVMGGAIMPDAGNADTAGILFPLDAGGGTGDKAWMRYYSRTGEKMTLEIGIANDGDDHIALMPSGSVGIGTNAPIAKLDIAQNARSGTHPTSINGLYVTGTFGEDSDGIEFRHSNGSFGIGFGYGTIYTNGSATDQDLGLKPRGTGKVIAKGSLQVSGGKILMDGAQKIAFADADTTNNLKVQLWTGYGLGINNGTLFYAANGNHSWRDNNGTNERMLLTTAADGGLTVKGTGNSAIAGSLAIGTTSAPKQRLDVQGRMNVENGVIQRGGDAITATSDLGLYSRVDQNYIRLVTTNGAIRFYTDGGMGTNHVMSIEPNGQVNIPGYLSAKQVYFSAYVETNSRTGNFNPLPMGVTSQNVGDAFSTSTGKFTAPVKGVYLFTMTALKSGDDSSNWLLWYLMVNDGFANSSGSSKDEPKERGLMSILGQNVSASRTMILSLNASDTVWVQQNATGTARPDNFRSGLEGVLLFAIP